MDFVGCKAALFHDGALLCYLRDDKASIPWPSMWDLPGGGREGDESAGACLLRELQEEFGLALSAERLIWRQSFASMLDAARSSWFFAGHLTAAEIAAIRFGDEGQHWQMMRVDDFLAHPLAIPELQRRVALALAAI
jgi:8-oxo-dGTP diphosphatase